VARFLSAYLTSDGELTRYLAPSSPIPAVHPPPFTAVEVLRSGMAKDPQRGTVVAVVARASDDTGRAQLLEEVTEILSAPPLATSNN
jgi:hypothetical protein